MQAQHSLLQQKAAAHIILLKLASALEWQRSSAEASQLDSKRLLTFVFGKSQQLAQEQAAADAQVAALKHQLQAARWQVAACKARCKKLALQQQQQEPADASPQQGAGVKLAACHVEETEAAAAVKPSMKRQPPFALPSINEEAARRRPVTPPAPCRRPLLLMH